MSTVYQERRRGPSFEFLLRSAKATTPPTATKTPQAGSHRERLKAKQKESPTANHRDAQSAVVNTRNKSTVYQDPRRGHLTSSDRNPGKILSVIV
jgi:hypothetical protein